MINLMQGDCLDKMKEIESGSVDMVLTDPPYGITACKWDSIIPLDPMWEQLKRIIKPNGAIVMTASQPFTTTLIASNMKMFKYCWYWKKSRATNFLNASHQPLRNIEEVVIFCKSKSVYNPQITDKDPKNVRNNSGKIHKQTESYGSHTSGKSKADAKKTHPKQCLEFHGVNPASKEKYHSTQKPVALMEYLIRTYTNEGETVLDFTMGSGSTGVAAKNLNRSFIGIELDQGYFEIAKERINNA